MNNHHRQSEQASKPAKLTPVHAAMDQFNSVNGQLYINGNPLDLAVVRAGQTPCYLYDRSVIRAKIQKLRNELPNELKLHYAVKANPMQAVIDFISPLVDGLDVASGKELQLALNSTMAGENISFAGPGKTIQEMSMAVASGVTVNAESFRQIDQLAKISEQLGVSAKVAIRVNPDFLVKSSGMTMGGGSQQFGIDAELAPHALKRITELGLDYQGLHLFTGSQNLNAESISDAHQGIFDLATRLQKQAASPIKLLNIGGGLGIPYFPGEKPIELGGIGEKLASLMEIFYREFPGADITMELGRYMVGEAGIYVARVIDLKTSRGVDYAVLDGGLHHHLSASGNFGQVIRKNYPVAVGNKMNQQPVKKYQLVGPLCTPLDLLASHYELPELDVDDFIVIYQSGAYGYTASPRDFLSHPQPVELLI